MSRKFNSKNKDLVNLEIKKAKDVWEKDKNGNYVLSPKYDYYGKIDKGLSAFVTITNKKGENSKFVEDTSNLSKKTKQEIVKTLSNDKTKVAYLVKKKN